MYAHGVAVGRPDAAVADGETAAPLVVLARSRDVVEARNAGFRLAEDIVRVMKVGRSEEKNLLQRLRPHAKMVGCPTLAREMQLYSQRVLLL
jgi:hypothetical protein